MAMYELRDFIYIYIYIYLYTHIEFSWESYFYANLAQKCKTKMMLAAVWKNTDGNSTFTTASRYQQ